MNIKELNESYEEYVLTEEYLVEGLMIFKKSKQLYKFSRRLHNKALSLKHKGKREEYLKLEKISKKIERLGDNYSAVEKSFKEKELDKQVAKQKLLKLKKRNEELLALLKKDQTKEILKFGGSAAIGVGLRALVTQLIIPTTLVSGIILAIAKGGTYLASKLGAGAPVTDMVTN